MTEGLPSYAPPRRAPTAWRGEEMQRRIRRRYASERGFHALGVLAIVVAASFLAFLLVSMSWNGAQGFMRTDVRVLIDFPAMRLPLQPAQLRGGDADSVLATVELNRSTARAVETALRVPAASVVAESSWLVVRDAVRADPSILARRAVLTLPAASGFAQARTGGGSPETRAIYAALAKQGAVIRSLNWQFLTGGDATDPDRVGIWSALKGSLLTMLVTLVLAFPVGVLSAIYLEEYAPRNRWTDLIEVSINNLAAVPSIIFGLLGLAVFLNTFNLPRSAPLVGGLTLALMTMPVIVIAARNAIKTVPMSIRDAALAVGASPVQVVFHHVLPLALPGILTGTIIAMSRALGETAPLLMIGMRMFVTAPPSSITDPATVLPMQIFLWSDEVNRSFIEKTSAAIIVLLIFLLAMNGIAIYLRDRFETRW